MKCPYCGEELDLYNDYSDYIDDNCIKVEEHYACYECNKNFWRDVIYKAIKEGALKE